LATPHQRSGIPLLSRIFLGKPREMGGWLKLQRLASPCVGLRTVQGASPRCQFTGQGPVNVRSSGFPRAAWDASRRGRRGPPGPWRDAAAAVARVPSRTRQARCRSGTCASRR